MSDLRIRPSRTFIYKADWKDLYVLTEHWKSDLLFYKDDLKFLDQLIDKYFMWLSIKENIDKAREIELVLVELDRQCYQLIKAVNKHLIKLGELVENPFKYNSAQFRLQHQLLEEKIANFYKNFKEGRVKVFDITEHVMESENLVRELT